MQEELITFETAKLAKKKGFTFNKRADYYTYKGELNGNCLEFFTDFVKSDRKVNSGFENVLAPTQSLLQRWLREVHKIYLLIDMDINRKYYWKYFNDTSSLTYSKGVFDTYEEALELGLQESLKLVNTVSHEIREIPCEEILKNRSSKYNFINFKTDNNERTNDL